MVFPGAGGLAKPICSATQSAKPVLDKTRDPLLDLLRRPAERGRAVQRQPTSLGPARERRLRGLAKLPVTHLNRRLLRDSWLIAVQPISFMSRSYFGLHQAKRPLDASLAGRSQRIEIVAADADRLGANRERLQDMGSPLDPAIHEHVDPITHGVDDLGQLIE